MESLWRETFHFFSLSCSWVLSWSSSVNTKTLSSDTSVAFDFTVIGSYRLLYSNIVRTAKKCMTELMEYITLKTEHLSKQLFFTVPIGFCSSISKVLSDACHKRCFNLNIILITRIIMLLTILPFIDSKNCLVYLWYRFHFCKFKDVTVQHATMF